MTRASNLLITGSNGFIGRNLILKLRERGFNEINLVTRETSPIDLEFYLTKSDVIIHLAGEMRTSDSSKFYENNQYFTKKICDILRRLSRSCKIIFTSTLQLTQGGHSDYTKSKYEAEQELKKLSENSDCSVKIYRLPHVFGKWARPFYNSAISTFCYSISRGLEVTINDHNSLIYPLYIDNLINQFIFDITSDWSQRFSFKKIENVHEISLGKLYSLLHNFNSIHQNSIIETVGHGLERELYSTFISYLPTERFSYPLKSYGDDRGVFVEFLKTNDSGQFSFFTAHPGITRGGHYHHSKTEKFLVIKGSARFEFRQILTNERFTIFSSGQNPVVVETIPGWAHDITNIGDEELLVMLWANEIFDKENPDTFPCLV